MRRIVSVVTRAPSPVPPDPVLEPNAFAVAEDVDLTVVLRGAGVEHARRTAWAAVPAIAGVALPSPDEAADLRGLLESGVPVLVDGADLARAGLAPDDVLSGAQVVGREQLLELLRTADGVLTW